MADYNLKKEKSLALIAAIAERNPAQVLARLEQGADIHYEIDRPLRSAVYLGYVDIAEILIQKGADVRSNGEEALYTALRAHDREMTNLLLNHGANLDFVLRNRKDSLDQESLRIVDEIKSRAAREAFQRNADLIREKGRQSNRPAFRPKGPTP